MRPWGRTRGRFRLAPLGPAAATLALPLAGCALHPQTTLSPAGPVARMEFGLMAESFWIMLGVFVVVGGLCAYVLMRFLERPGAAGHVPKQVEGHHLLELLWTVVPFILLVILVIPTFRDTFALSAAQPGALQVDVIGHQFWWEFDYPGLHIKTADELHIPAGRPVNLRVTSADVIHSFWVPRLAGKQAAIPGHTNFLWIEADRPGTYLGQCAEFCGTSHSEMHFDVVAQTPTAFAAWVQDMQRPVVKPATALAKEGESIFASTGCGGCHAINGTDFTGTVGPNLTGLGQHGTIAAGVFTNTPQNLAAWISDPPAVMPGTIMPDFHLSKAKVRALVAYLEGLR